MIRFHSKYLVCLSLMTMLASAGCKGQAGSHLLPARARRGMQWGYIDAHGAFVIQPRFDEVEPFSGLGYATVRLGSRWGVIDRSGRIVLPTKYASIQDGGHVWAVATEGTSWELLKKRTLEVFAKNVSEWRIGRNVIPVQRQGELWMGIDAQSGRIVFPPRFRQVRAFLGGLAAATSDGSLWGYIDEKGDWSIPPKWVEARTFHEGLAIVAAEGKREQLYGIIDKDGDYLVRPCYSSLKYIKGDVYAFSPSEETSEADPTIETWYSGLLNVRTGEVLVGPSDVDYKLEVDGYIVVGMGVSKKVGDGASAAEWPMKLVNINGREVLEAKYDLVVPLVTDQSLAIVLWSDKWSVVDRDGNLILPMVYDDIWSSVINEEIIRVRIEGVCEGYQKLSGEWVYWWDLHGQSKR